MNSDQLEAMLTARQVADFLQVSISTVRRWSDRGMLQFYRIGSRGDRRYRREDVLRFLHESTGRSQEERTAQRELAGAGANGSPVALRKPKRAGSRPVRE
jgi:excisionase family DNA binding protein